MSNTLDAKVLDHLQGIQGSTAYMMRNKVGTTREEVSKACQRLKRKGLITASGTYWQAVKP